MPPPLRTKRKYARLPASTWSEIASLWELGDATLPELADRYGVAERTLQAHFAKRGIVKGSKAAEIAESVRQAVFDAELPDQELVTERAKDVREAAYQNAVAIEKLVMAQVKIARTDPSQAMRASTVIKGLALAASALERLHGLKYRALGLDQVVDQEELPALRVEVMTKAEIATIRSSQGADDTLDELPDETLREPTCHPCKTNADDENCVVEDEVVDQALIARMIEREREMREIHTLGSSSAQS